MSTAAAIACSAARAAALAVSELYGAWTVASLLRSVPLPLMSVAASASSAGAPPGKSAGASAAAVAASSLVMYCRQARVMLASMDLLVSSICIRQQQNW